MEVLNLHATNIEYIDSRIGCLKKLRKLDISRTQIKKLPKELGQLDNLLELYAYDIDLKDLDFDKKIPVNLIRLDISNTRIRQIPSNIYNLQKLKLLNVSNTEIDKLSEDIVKLSDLEMLNISRTKIKILPKYIGKIRNLQIINASFSCLEELPIEIGEATYIRKIMINYTHVKTLPDVFKNLKKLQLLNLSGLYLDYIPQSLADSKLKFVWTEQRYTEYGIVINNTVFDKMPLSILLQKKELLNEYYKTEKTVFNEGKIILLGNGDVGKSYIIERIINNGEQLEDGYEPLVTQGISVKQLELRNDFGTMKMNIWDFGGQEILHSMHRMFLTERSLYLIVLNARYDELQSEAEKWLKIVESFAPRSSVILIINKMDLNEFASLNETCLYEKFISLKFIKKISAKYDSKLSFNTLIDTIVECCRLGMCGMQIPISWNQIRLEIEQREEKYIYMNTFQQICKNCSVMDREIQNWILNWFRDIGVCFIMNNVYFKNYIILDLQWMLNLIYKIIYVGKNKSTAGYLDIDSLSEYFTDFPKEQYMEFTMALEIMRQFGISYNLNQHKEFIPMLLDKNEKTDIFVWCNKAKFIFECRYMYLPISLFHQLFLNIFSKIMLIECWYTGILFRYNDTDIEICIKAYNSNIQIYTYNLDNICINIVKEILKDVSEISKNMNLRYENYIIIREKGLEDCFSFERIRIMLEHNKLKDFSHVLKREINLKKMNGCLPISIELEDNQVEDKRSVTYNQYFLGHIDSVNNYSESQKMNERQATAVLDINEIIQNMCSDIRKAEIDEKYELELRKINSKNQDFNEFISYIEDEKWDEFYKHYTKIIKSYLDCNKDNSLINVVKINFTLGVVIWKYYKMNILTFKDMPLFFFFPLDTQFFPIVIYFKKETLFDIKEIISYIKNNKIFDNMKYGEYKDILLIQGVIQKELNIIKEYIHYK